MYSFISYIYEIKLKFSSYKILKEKPYVMVKDDANLTGNARFEGFCIDLLKAIAAQVGFHYKIEVVPDNMYGVYNPETETWNGIVRELMERVRNYYFLFFFLHSKKFYFI